MVKSSGERGAAPGRRRGSARRAWLAAPVLLTALVLLVIQRGGVPGEVDPGQPGASRQQQGEAEPGPTAGSDPEDVAAEDSRRPAGSLDGSPLLEVRVEAPDGRRIEGAFVQLSDGASVRLARGRAPLGREGASSARTGPDGLVRLAPPEVPAGEGFALLARAAGYQEQVASLAAPLAPRTRLVLQPSPGIAGLVRRADGLPAGAGIRVVAVPSESGPVGREAALRALEGSPLVHSTVTDEDGRFRLDAVREGRSYYLEAGGGGLATLGPRKGREQLAAAGATDVELVLQHLYQCLIEHLDQDGNPVRSALFSAQDATSIGSLDGRLRTAATLHASALLAGQDPALSELPRHILWYLFESDEALDPAGPVDLRQRTVGYAPVNLEFLARPLSQEAVIERVRLQQLAAGLTTLDVRFVREGRPARSVPGRLQFYGEDGAPSFLVFWSGENSAEPAQLESFPVGRYSWRFESTRGPFVHPPVEQALPLLDTARDTEIVIELDAAGDLLVDIFGPDGRPYEGLALMLIEPGLVYVDRDGVVRGGGSQLVTSRGPPFRVEGLPLGRELELISISPATGSQPGADRVRFQLGEGGGESRVELRLRSALDATGD